MEANNWRPTQPVGETPLDTSDWRAQLQPESRQRIVNKIMETLKRHLPSSGSEGINELGRIASRFEEKIHAVATDQTDYLRKISLKMLSMENKSQNISSNSLPSGSTLNTSQSLDPAAQVLSQPQSLPDSLPANQASMCQQMLPQNIQSNVNIPGSASFSSSTPPVSGLPQNTIPILTGQNSNIQNIPGGSQNSIGNSMGQAMSLNVFANSQGQMLGRPQVLPQQQQQQSQHANSLYQHQLRQQLLKQNLCQGNLNASLMHKAQLQQQQQQQNLLQPTSQQTTSVMQPSLMQSTPSGLSQNQQSSVQQPPQSMLQQHPQSMVRQQHQSQQAASVHQHQTPMTQQVIIPSQQQRPVSQQMSSMNMQQNQIIGQQNSGDLLPQQQPHTLHNQQNNLPSLHQQQVMAHQNNLSNMHQQQLGPQSNVSGLPPQQQQQLLGNQSGNFIMQSNQHSVHMPRQSKVSPQQQTQHARPSSLASRGQQLQQPQAPQQQVMMQQVRSQQPVQFQQQSGLQQPVNHLQRDMQQRLQAPGSSLQPQTIAEQQKPLYQPQRVLPENSSTSLDSTAQTGSAGGGDWQEEVYQKIKALKEMYLTELTELHHRLAIKLQQHDSLPQQPISEQLEKVKMYKVMLERIIAFISVPKSGISPTHKEKLSSYEKHILHFINNQRPRRPMQQQGQQPHPAPPSQMHSMQQTTTSQVSQVTQVQSHDNNQMNQQLQLMNMQSSVSTNRHNSPSPLSGVSASQSSMLTALHPVSRVESGQENAVSSSQKVALASLQQNSASASQPLQPNINSVHSQSSMLHQQHLKQQQEHMQHNQQLKQQFHNRQIQQQLMQKQQLMQQQQQLQNQAKQQIQMPHLHHDMNDLRMRQGLNINSGFLQQHPLSGQRSFSPNQQVKPGGAQLPNSSPQLPQAASPQMPHHSSPQLDQQNLPPTVTKTGTPLQSASSPFVVPSPITPLAPSPVPGYPEKPISGQSSLLNAGTIGHPQTIGVQGAPQSVSKPSFVKSASPLPELLVGQDGTQGNTQAIIPVRPVVKEQPINRLIKAVKSISSKSLASSVSDIGSVVNMMDTIAESALGEGSRASVGEDLVTMTKCCLRARNFIAHDGTNGSKMMKWYTSGMPLTIASPSGSVGDSFHQLSNPESEVDSTTSTTKRPRLEPKHALFEEIKEINRRLIDTVVDISDEDTHPSAAASVEGGEGTIVKCCFSAVALCPSLKSMYASAQKSPIQPLRLLVPVNYPNCSPILLDKFPVEVSQEYEDLSAKAKSRFSRSLRTLSEPLSLKDIARAWDACARAVVSEYAEQCGGGTFSSKYGSWDNCLSAA